MADFAIAPRPAVVRRGFAILARAVREEPRMFAISFTGSVAYGAMIIAQAYVLGAATTHLVKPAIESGHARVGWVAITAVGILAVAFIKISGIVGRRLGAGVMQYRLQAAYRRRVTRRYLALPMSWHARHSTGTLLSNANADVEALWYPIAPFPFAAGIAVIAIVTIVVLFLTNIALALIGLLVFPAIVVSNACYASLMAPRMQRTQRLRGEVSAVAHESFEGALVVKTLGREDAETERFAERATELRDTLIQVGRLRGLFDPLLEAIPNVGTLLVLVVGASQVDTGTLVRVAYLFGLLAFPLRAIGWVLTEIPRSVAGDERVSAVLDASGELTYGSTPASTVGDGHGPVRLSVDDVSYSYADPDSDHERPSVLRGLTFDVPAGRTVALVGPTGSGKSTIAALLVRLFDPAEGTVRFEDHDLRGLGRGAVSDVAALVAQQTFLFDDTVRGNVTLGADTTDEQVWAALAAAQAERFVRALPHGLDTVIGERGTTLSGGQRQRLALARALVRDPRLLVLDDATSSVDPTLERAILDGLRDGRPTTTVLIAYRKATIALADEVLFLADGRIVDRGPHSELMERNEAYAAIVSAYDLVAERAG